MIESIKILKRDTSRAIFGTILFCLLVSGVAWNARAVWLPPGPALDAAIAAQKLWDEHTLESSEFAGLAKMLHQQSKASHGVHWQDVFVMTKWGAYWPKSSLLFISALTVFYAIFGWVGLWILEQLLIVVIVFSSIRLVQTMSDNRIGLGRITILIFGSSLLWYSYGLSYDLFGTALIVCGLDLSRKIPFAGAALIASSALIRPINILYCLLAFALPSTAERFRISRICAGIAGMILIIGLFNLMCWGSPFTFQQQRLVAFNDGEIFFGHQEFHFSTLLHDWQEKLFGINAGLLLYSPVFVLGPIALLNAIDNRARRFILMSLVVTAAEIALIFSYPAWRETSMGNRFLLPAAMLNAVIGCTLTIPGWIALRKT